MSNFQIAFRPELTSPRLSQEKTNVVVVVLYVSCVTPMCPLTQSVKIEFDCIQSLQHDLIRFETEDAGGQDETSFFCMKCFRYEINRKWLCPCMITTETTAVKRCVYELDSEGFWSSPFYKRTACLCTAF